MTTHSVAAFARLLCRAGAPHKRAASSGLARAFSGAPRHVQLLDEIETHTGACAQRRVIADSKELRARV
jgi:hypothetical protein